MLEIAVIFFVHFIIGCANILVLQIRTTTRNLKLFCIVKGLYSSNGRFYIPC